MKKTILLLFFIATSLHSQTVNYIASTEIIANPERGFYKYTRGNSVGTFVPLDVASISAYRATNKISLIQRNYVLDAFRTTPISQDFLNKIQNDFAVLRNAGAKCVLRFLYSTVDDNDATKAQMIAHINQLKTVTIPNEDVISSLSGGFIAQYGEWYNSSNFGTENLTAQNLIDRKEIGLKIMELVPNSMVAWRTPFIQRLIGGDAPITAATAYNGSINSRCAAHNDCFLSNTLDYGTYDNRTTDFTYLENQSKYTFDGGEVCNLSEYSTCSNALFSMNRFHFAYLNFDYNTAVHDYWQTNGCLDEIKRRIGYRFEMINSNITDKTLTLNLQNVGFANVFNERKAYLIMKNLTNGVEYSFLLNTNVRFWQSGSQVKIVQNLEFPSLPKGTYQLYLNLPDLMLNNVLYAIQCANVGTWYSIKGYNDLQQTYTITNLKTHVFVHNNIIDISNLDNYTLQVFDLSGKLVSTSYDISDLPNSVYIVKVKSEGELYVQKVVKR